MTDRRPDADDLAERAVVVHHPNWPYPAPRGEGGLIELDRHTLDALDAYDTSVPTGPSPGRVYSRRHWVLGDGRRRWLNRWTVFICEVDPDDLTGTYHHPHEVLFAEGSDRD